MMRVTLYHGTSAGDLVPTYTGGLLANDFGRGFYLTADFEAAKGCACGRVSDKKEGYVYRYELDLDGLTVFDFRTLEENWGLAWAAEVLRNRPLDGDPAGFQDVVQSLTEHFSVDTSGYDVVIGPCAGDSYFRYVEELVLGWLSVQCFSTALTEGRVPLQYCIKSEETFNRLLHTGTMILRSYDYDDCRQCYLERDGSVREAVADARRQGMTAPVGELSLADYLRVYRRRSHEPLD